MSYNDQPKAQQLTIPGVTVQNGPTTDNIQQLQGDLAKATPQDKVAIFNSLSSVVGQRQDAGGQAPVKQIDPNQLNLSNPLDNSQNGMNTPLPERNFGGQFNQVKRILAACIPPTNHDDRIYENNKQYISTYYMLQTKVSQSDFKDLDWIIYNSIEYFSEINGIVTKPLLVQYVAQYGDKLLKSKLVDINRILQHKDLFIDQSQDSNMDQIKTELYPMIFEYFDELQGIEVTREEFNSQLKMYCDQLFSNQQERILKEALIIKSKGMDVTVRGERKFLFGATDSDEHYQRNIQFYKLKYLKDNTNKVIDTSSGASGLKEIKEDLKDSYKVVATLGVTKVDEMFKGFRPTKCLGIEGGASSGKTRLSRGITYRALVDYKQDVLDITMEQPRAEIFYIYVSTHLMAQYNIYIPDNKILADELTDQERHLVSLAELDLATNEDYGRLRIESRNMNIESAIQELKAIKATIIDYGVCLVDYVGLIGSNDMGKYGGTDKHQIVTTFYQKFKREICVELNVFGIILNQLSSDGVNSLAKGGETTTYHGSNSGETYKTPDYNIVCFQNEQLRKAKQIQLTFPKVRLGNKSGAIYASTPMGAAVFRDVKRKSDDIDREIEEEEASA